MNKIDYQPQEEKNIYQTFRAIPLLPLREVVAPCHYVSAIATAANDYVEEGKRKLIKGITLGAYTMRMSDCLVKNQQWMQRLKDNGVFDIIFWVSITPSRKPILTFREVKALHEILVDIHAAKCVVKTKQFLLYVPAIKAAMLAARATDKNQGFLTKI
ncbi:MAG: hypothetical protein ABW007_19500 [Chitinophagaceae bacterium]